jgi:stringent starvation protein B
MMRYSIIKVVVVLAVGASVPSAFADEGVVSFHVSPAASSFAAGRFSFQNGIVHFTASIMNGSSRTVSVCRHALGNVNVEFANRDGRPVSTRTVEAYFADGARRCSAEEMVSLRPGKETTFDVRGVSSVQLGQHNLRTEYGSGESGAYVIVFSYRYDGPDFGMRGVFHDRLTSNAVEFTLVTTPP